jgi:hypothetical protein
MSGLAGIVFAVLVFTDHDRATAFAESERRLLFASASLLAIAFILAPFVRRAFVPPVTQESAPARPRTLLDEMRAGDTGESPTTPQPELTQKRPATLTSRLIVALYIAFAAVLTAVLWTL